MLLTGKMLDLACCNFTHLTHNALLRAKIGNNRAMINTEGSFRMGMAIRPYHYGPNDTAAGPNTATDAGAKVVDAAGVSVSGGSANGGDTDRLNGPFKPFSFKEGMGAYEGTGTIKRYRPLWDLCKELVSALDPNFSCTYTSVQVMHIIYCMQVIASPYSKASGVWPTVTCGLAHRQLQGHVLPSFLFFR